MVHLKMRVWLFLLSLYGFANLSAQPLSGTYTIGGASPNYTTFTAATAALETNGISGPVVFNVRNGTYTEAVYITAIPGSSPTNTITFQSESGDSSQVILTYGGASNTFWGDTLKNLVLRKMTFRNTYSGQNFGAIFLQRSGNVKVQNCVMRGTGTWGYGFASGNADSAVYVQNCWAYNCDYSVFIYDSSPPFTKDVRIEYNTIASPDYGLYLDQVMNTVVKNNFVQGNFIGVNLHSVGFEEFHHNQIRSAGGKGILMINCFGSNNTRLKMYDNLILITSSVQTNNQAISIDLTNRLEFIHNTVYLTTTHASDPAFYIDGADSCFIYDNIFMCNGPGYAYQSTSNTHYRYSDYNVLYTNGSFLAPGISSLAQWQSTYLLDFNSIYANPQFVNIPNNLHPTNATVDGRGIFWSTVTDDLIGIPRHPQYPDPGCYEFSIAPLANLGPDISQCGAGPVLNAGNNGSYYLWSTGATSQSIIANVSGTYWVRVTNLAGVASDTINVTVHPLPTVSITGNSSLCSQDTVLLNATTTATTFSWSPSLGLDNNNTSTVHASPATSTIYTLTVTDNFGCSSTDSISLTVHPLPIAQAGNDQAICIGNQVILGTSSGSNCSWSPALGLSSATDCQPSAAPSANTSYTLTVSDAFGCINSDTVSVIVHPLPSVSVCCPQTLCAGDTAAFTATSSATALSWSPAFGLSTTSGAFTEAYPSTTTTYTVTATDSNGCINADSVLVTVNPTPAAPTITQNGIVLVSSETSGNQWYLNGNAISGATSTTYTPVTNGNYTVEYTDINGCHSMSAVYFFGSTGVPTIATDVFVLYSTDTHNLLFKEPLDNDYQLTVYNQVGEIIQSGPVPQSTVGIPLYLPAGVFLLLLKDESRQFALKVVSTGY